MTCADVMSALQTAGQTFGDRGKAGAASEIVVVISADNGDEQ